MASLSICVVTQQYESVFSGIGLYAQILITGLVADGHNVTIVAPQNQIPHGTDSIRKVAVPAPQLASSQARWLSLSLYFARALSVLQGNTSFDLIHFTDARESLLCKWYCPAIGDVQDAYATEANRIILYRKYYQDWLPRWIYYQFTKLCEARAYPRLQALIANSQYTASKVASQYSIVPERLFVCYKTIHQEYWTRSLNLRTHIPSHPPRAIFVGGNLQRKGLPVLIAAVARLRNVISNLEVWVVGADKTATQMQILCREFGVSEQFRFWGWRSQQELIELYAQADVFVMPSFTEGFGYVFLEAMAAGLPIIGSRAGGIAEIIENGINGILVNPGDVEDLALALELVLSNRDIAIQLQQAGLETVKQFNMNRMMNCTYAVYESVLQQKKCSVSR